MLKRVAARLWDTVVLYALKFGVVGLIGFVIDVGLFNLLRLGAFGDSAWWQTAIGAKVISTSVAIVFNWIGNRYWTFREHRRRNALLEFLDYTYVSVAGMGIAVGCLWFSHHVLGLDSLVADNISTNVIGLGFGTAFRFVLYRYWVFGHNRTGARVENPNFADTQRALFQEPVAQNIQTSREL